MKRINNLYESIISIENLRLADGKARKGKLHSYGVIKHDKNKEKNIIELHNILSERMYMTSEYHIFKIYEPKERDIYQLPYYPDRILHHAVMNILEPIWTPLFIENTYSCIKGRGIHKAVRDIKDVLIDEENTKYCLKIDIAKFYPSINHDILKLIIRKKIKDKDLLVLLDEIIDSAKGVPIGNYLSQYFANLYLAYFDHWLKEEKQVRYYFRYADDIVILHKDKKYLHNLRKEIEEYLLVNLKLSIEKNIENDITRKYQVFPVESRGIDFLGYRFFHTHVLLRKSIKKNLCKKINKLNKMILPDKEYKRKLCGNLGWAIHCNSKHLLNKTLNKNIYEVIFRQ